MKRWDPGIRGYAEEAQRRWKGMNTRTWQSPEWLRAAPELTSSAFHRNSLYMEPIQISHLAIQWRHTAQTRLTEANSEPWEKEKYSFIKPEQLPASLIASSGSLWAKQHQNQKGLGVLVLPHARVWSWYRGTKSSVLQQVQSCALRPQGIAKSTQLTLVCKEEKLKFQPADNSMSPITTHQELQGLFYFKPTVF